MANTQQSIDKLNKYTERLELLNKQLEDVNKNTKEYKRLTKEKATVEEKAIKTSKELASAQGKLSSTLPTHKRLIDAANQSQKRFNATTQQGSVVSKGFFGKLKTAVGTLSRYALAYAGVNAAIGLLRELFVNSAKRAIQLERALADVAAIANLTASDMSRLEKVVFDVSGTTSLTAIEVVELQKQLAKLGTSVDDLENLTRPVALLSQALGEEPGGVASALKKALNQFQATTEEADKFANVLVGAVNESALSLNDLGTALQYVGPLAAQSGLTFSETASLLGILADNGFRASRAGTGLSNILIEAAKDGRPFIEFLEDVSRQNLNVAEATDVFGKRSAAAAITLSKNIDEIKELNKELQDNTRLLSANAKQMSSTGGQIDLLTSAYNKASIRLGDYITQTEFFLELLELLDPAVASQARAFKVIAQATAETSVGFNSLTDSLVDFEDTTEQAAINTSQALFDVLESSGNLTNSQVQILQDKIDKGENLINTLRNWASQGIPGVDDQLLLAEGLVELASERANAIREERIAIAAKNEDYNEAINLTNRLTESAKEGLLVEKEQDRVSKGLGEKLKGLREERERSTDVDEIIVLEKRISLYKELVDKVDNLENNQSAIDKKRADAQKTLFSSELMRIQSTLDAEIDAIKAITNVELAGAKDAEQAAQIRLKQEKLIQAAYNNSINSVEELKNKYPDFADEIQKTSDKYQKFTEFTQSEIGKEGITILKDYKKSFEELGKQLKDETITLGEYEVKEAALEASLISSITTIKDSTVANQELKDMLDKIVLSYLNAKKSAEDYQKASEDTKKTIKALGQAFVVDLSIEEAVGMALASTGEIISKFNDTALENTKNRLDAEKEEIASRYEVEQDILKSQLDNQLITETQFRTKQKELRRAKIAEENAVDKKIFESEKKRDRQNATTGYLQALGAIIPNLIIYDKEANPIGLSIKAALSGALATASYGAELAAIGQKKFFPKKFADGGVVNGPSHAQGGVPFTVQGRGGYEMEGGEFIVNKDATSRNYDLLKRINDSTRVRPIIGSRKFADGGLVSSPMNESVDYLKAIAEATTSTAIQTSKPVRAFVTSSDLRTNETERRLRDRNDKI